MWSKLWCSGVASSCWGVKPYFGHSRLACVTASPALATMRPRDGFEQEERFVVVDAVSQNLSIVFARLASQSRRLAFGYFL